MRSRPEQAPAAGRGLSRRRIVAGACASVVASHAAPSRGEGVVRLLVPFPAGGSIDALARALAPSLGRRLDATIVVANIPGAGGRIATRHAIDAAPDGRTLLLGTSATQAIAVSLFRDLPYRPEQDFVGVGCICTARLVLVASPALGVHTLADLVRVARAAPAPLPYGSWGIGSGGHLMVEAMRREAGIALTHVPFPGIAPMMQTLLGGHMPLAISDVGGAVALIRAQKVDPVLVSGRTRLAWMPDVATLAESQVAVAPDSWCGLFASARTPERDLARLEGALQATLKEPETSRALAVLAFEPRSLDRSAFQQLWHADVAAWRRIVVATRLELD